MQGRPSRTNLIHLGVMAAVLVGSVATAALAAGPIGSPAGSAAPEEGARADNDAKADRGAKRDKAAKAPKVEVTVNGTVGTRTDASGATEYTLTSGATVLVLDAGPPWFFKGAHPLAPYVGKQVTIVGRQREGSTEIDVRTVDGTALREPGKPPWAGGWKVVGEAHPGWTQERWDRWQARLAERMARFGLECWPPGHCKDGSAKDATPGSSPAP